MFGSDQVFNLLFSLGRRGMALEISLQCLQRHVWHSNRHTFCSWLAMAGASIKEIQELAGHKTITMSARYSHLSPEHRLSVIDRIATVS